MTIVTYEGVVEKGNILLDENIQLPEHAKVYVIITEEVIPVTLDGKKPIQILSPRLVNRGDAEKFKLSVSEENPNA